MKKLSSHLYNMLSHRDPRHFYLVRLGLSEVAAFTTLPFSVTLDGELFVSDGGLLEVEPPRHSTQSDKATYRIAISDHDFTMENRLAEAGTCAPISVYLGFYNSDDEPVVNSYDNLLHVYSGFIDTWFKEETDEAVKLVIQGASPMASLDTVSSVFTNKDTALGFDPDDQSFDFISTASADEVTLQWGKS